MNGGRWAEQTAARAGLHWCDARHIYPPRCQGPCRRTYVQMARDRVAMTYSADHGPLCEECADMAALIDWQACYGNSTVPLWQEAEKLHDEGKTWREVAETLNARYGLELAWGTCSSQVKYYQAKCGDNGGDGGGARAAKEGNGDESDESFGGRGFGPAAVEDEGRTAAPLKRRPPDGNDDGNDNGDDDGQWGRKRPPGKRVPGNGEGGSHTVVGGEVLAECRIEIHLPGLQLTASAPTPEQLQERMGIAEAIIGRVAG